MEQELPTRPLLKPWYRLTQDSSRTVLEHAGSAVVIAGRAAERFLPALLPLLDGQRTLDDVVSHLGQEARPAVCNAVEQLYRHGVVTEGPALPRDLAPSFAGTADLLAAAAPDGAGPAETFSRVAASTVALLGSGSLCVEIARLLRLSGVANVERMRWADPLDGWPELDLGVAAPSAAELPALAELNRNALSTGACWLQVLPFDGRHAAVGPLYFPGETCCYRCYLTRRASTSGFREEFAALDDTRPERAPAPMLTAAIAGFAATFILRWLAYRDPQLPGSCWALELWPQISVTPHVVYRVPRCPECSGLGGLAPPAPWFEAAE